MDEITDKQIDELIANSRDYIDKTAIDFDNVECVACGYDGLVNLGDEDCPKCKEKGCLKWKEGQPQEVSI